MSETNQEKMLHFVRHASDAQLVEIAIKMIAKHPETFDEIFTESRPENSITLDVPFTGQKVNFTEKDCEKIRAAYNNGQNKIGGIKEIRSITNLALKEAKDLLESDAFQRIFGGP